MAFDSFIKFDGIPGESKDDKHKDWIEVLSFSQEMDQPASATGSSAGGSTAERVNFSTYNIVHYIDKASTKLAEACCKGTHIKEVTIDFCRSGGDKLTYYTVKLEQVLVSNIQLSGTHSDDAGFPTESISLTFGKISWTYTQQGADGKAAGQIFSKWDLTTNK